MEKIGNSKEKQIHTKN